jgi:hypothetical protein
MLKSKQFYLKSIIIFSINIISFIGFSKEIPIEVFHESFEKISKELKKQGWKYGNNAKNRVEIDSKVSKHGSNSLKITANSPKYAIRYFPVKAGEYYTGEVWIKTENLTKLKGQSRGAVLFLQFADKKRRHVSGGSFPVGLRGNNDWKLQRVPFTIKIPSNVSYIYVTLGIEGKGTAWFDGLKFAKIRTGWKGPHVISPIPGQTIHSRLPVFNWKKINTGMGSYALHISKSPKFPEDETIHLLGYKNIYPNQWLSPGKWYFRIIVEGLPMPAGHAFYISKDSVYWPTFFKPMWSWNDKEKPELKLSWLKPINSTTKLTVKIDGKDAEITKITDSWIYFRPVEKLKCGIHKILVRAESQSGKVLTKTMIFCNKKPRCVVSFNKDRIMSVNGKPFFPLGTYRDPSDKMFDYSGIVEAGFNLTHDYSFEHTPRTIKFTRKYLDKMHEANLKVFLGLPRIKIARQDISWIKNYVAEVMDHPAILSWYISDEPEIRNLSPNNIKNIHDAIKTVDPFHPTMTVYCKPDFFHIWKDSQDIMCSDIYPLPEKPINTQGKGVHKVRNAIGSSRPTWTVLQAHDLRFFPIKNVKKAFKKYGRPAMPTPEQIRVMAFLSLAASSDGLIWYWLPKHHFYDIVKDSPNVWKGLCQTIHLLKSMTPWLTARRTKQDILKSPQTEVRFWTRQFKSVRLLAVINSNESMVSTKVDLAPFNVGKILNFETDKLVDFKNNLYVELKPLEVKIFKMILKADK